MDLDPVARDAIKSSTKDSEPIWREVVCKLRIDRAPGETFFDAFRGFLEQPTGPRVALIFDECDTLRKLPELFLDWLMCVRVLSQDPDIR